MARSQERSDDPSGFIKCREAFNQLRSSTFLKKTLLHEFSRFTSVNFFYWTQYKKCNKAKRLWRTKRNISAEIRTRIFTFTCSVEYYQPRVTGNSINELIH
jgi:hypothetical protein